MTLRDRVIFTFGLLSVLNVGAWLCAAIAFHDRLVLLGVAFVIYGLGLRHAVDADHIAAIDNVTRKLLNVNLPFSAIMVFPVLFAAGMSLVDTADGVLMLGAYDWAFVKPIRKLYYNMTITLVSVVIAVLIEGIEALGLISRCLDCHGGAWEVIRTLADNMNLLGFLLIGLFAVDWAVSIAIYKAKHLDTVDAQLIRLS